MVFGWLDASAAKQFGKTLGTFYIAQMPVELKLSEKKFAERTQTVMRKMAGQVEAFKAEHKLNGYKKAQLGNSFKWALKDAGYDAAYTDKLTDWLVTRL
jgi:hypothetical protein